jgi:hypothetical protein
MTGFTLRGNITDIEVIATGRSLRNLKLLVRLQGRGRWRKLRGSCGQVKDRRPRHVPPNKELELTSSRRFRPVPGGGTSCHHPPATGAAVTSQLDSVFDRPTARHA